MKKLILFFLLLAVIDVYGQDVIVLKDGSTILSKILEVGTKEIRYKKYSNQDGPLYSISKTDVLSINYQNGEKDLFTQPSESTASNAVENTPTDKEYKLEAGTQIPLHNVNYLRASNLRKGDAVSFRVGRDVKAGDYVVIPYGTNVKGIVYEARKSGGFGTKGRLGIKIDRIELPGGIFVPLANGDIYITGKNRTTLSVLLFLFVTWPACFITGSKAELQAGYEVVATVANPVVFKEQQGRLEGKVISVSTVDNKESGPKHVVIKLKGTGYIKAIIDSEDDQYIYYRHNSKPNGKIQKIKKKRVKRIEEL